MMGASFKWDINGKNASFKPFIINPLDNERIYIILDPSHMIKLTRNRLASCEKFLDGAGNKIEWRYIVSLYEYSLANDFHTHKLTKKHVVDWERHDMNVRIAVETFSESVASSIEVLMNQNVPEFQGAEATILFIRTMNTLFDCFNSWSSFNQNVYKNKLSPDNKRIVFDFFTQTMKYFNQLQVEKIHYKKAKKGKKDDSKNARSNDSGKQSSCSFSFSFSNLVR